MTRGGFAKMNFGSALSAKGKISLIGVLACSVTIATVISPAQKLEAAPVNKVKIASAQLPAKPAKSLAQLEKDVQDKPDDAGARLALGQALLAKKDFARAKSELRIAVRMGKGSLVSQKANTALLTMPKSFVKPKTGAETRMIASMLGLGRTRGLEGSKPTVIDFSAKWCQPCKQLDGVIGKLKTDYGDKVAFMRVDVDDPNSQALLDQYEVSPIPTIVYLNTEGEVVNYSVGYSGENSVKDGISKILVLGNK